MLLGHLGDLIPKGKKCGIEAIMIGEEVWKYGVNQGLGYKKSNTKTHTKFKRFGVQEIQYKDPYTKFKNFVIVGEAKGDKTR